MIEKNRKCLTNSEKLPFGCWTNSHCKIRDYHFLRGRVQRKLYHTAAVPSLTFNENSICICIT